MSTMLDAALAYAAFGWPVFPVTPNQKKPPLIKECQKLASTDPAQIRAWWTRWPNANIAIRTGDRVGTVIDIDPRHDGDKTLADLEQRHVALPVTLTQATPSGGFHRVFQYSPGVKNQASELGAGLDTRNTNGYILAAPSRFEGKAYRWLTPFETPLAPLPRWVIERLAAGNGTRPGPGPQHGPIPSGARNSTLFALGRSWRAKGLSDTAIGLGVVEANATRCRPPLTDAEVEAIVASVLSQPNEPGFGTDANGAEHPGIEPDYLEPLATFLSEEDRPQAYVFPEILPVGVILLIHGEPRARKSLVGLEFALAGATGTAPFRLQRFQPAGPIPVVYVQEEDPRSLTRVRLRRLVAERCGATIPDTLHVSIRKGVNLDDPAWVTQLIADLIARGARLLVLDAARRLSAKTDEGPAKVRELIAVFRRIVDEAGVTLIVVHHDVKPPRDGQDQRRRGQRASGGDWFAGCECPVHVERLSEHESQVFPQDYKFSSDPAPFQFRCEVEILRGVPLIRRMVGKDISVERAERAGDRGKLLAWLSLNPDSSKTAIKAAGFRWEKVGRLLEDLTTEGIVGFKPGRTRNSTVFYVIGDPFPNSGNGSPSERVSSRGETNA